MHPAMFKRVRPETDRTGAPIPVGVPSVNRGGRLLRSAPYAAGMTLPPLAAEIALLLLPAAAGRALALLPGHAWRVALAAAIAGLSFVAVAIVGLAPPVPHQGVWAALEAVGVAMAPLAGLALATTTGVAAWTVALGAERRRFFGADRGSRAERGARHARVDRCATAAALAKANS